MFYIRDMKTNYKENVLSNRKVIFQRAFNLAKAPIIISIFVTPENVIFIIGLLWLALAFSVYWGIKLYNENHRFLLLLLSLIIFSPISRIPVAILWWIDTRWEIGTHYSLYFDNFAQAFFQQVVYGSLTQIIPGFLLGSLTLVIMKKFKSD